MKYYVHAFGLLLATVFSTYSQGTVPGISSITINALSHSSVNIQFRTTTPSWVALKYGLSSGNYVYTSASYQSYSNAYDANNVDATISLGGLAPGTTYYVLPTARPDIDDDTSICETPACGAIEQVFTTQPLPAVHPAPPAPPNAWVPTEPVTTSYTVIPMQVSSVDGECVAAANVAGQPGWNGSVLVGDNITTILGKIFYGTVIEFPQGATCNVPQTDPYWHTGYSLPLLPLDPMAVGQIGSPNHRWIVFRTRTVSPADFPPFGVRTGPQWANKLAKLVVQTPGNPTDGSSPGLGVQNFSAQLFDCYRQGCHHFWFENMEWTHLAHATVYPGGIVDPPAFGPYFRAVPNGSDITTQSTTPDYNVIDRIYAHGQPWPSREFALFAPGGNHWAIVNSYAQANMWFQGVFPVVNPTMSGSIITIPPSVYQYNSFDNTPIGMKGNATASFQVPGSYSGVFYAWIDSSGLTIDYQTGAGVSLQCAGCTAKSEASPSRGSVPATSMWFFNGHFSNGAAVLDQSMPWNTIPTALSGFRPIGIIHSPGNFAYVDNNYISAIGQAVYNDPDGPRTDATWTHNYFYFPRSKMKNSGQWDGYGYSFRNDFETKQALRWRLEGNIFDGSAAYQNPGHAVYVAGSYGASFSNGTQDISIRNNILKHLSAGFQCAGGGAASPPDSPTAERIEVFNNLWLDLNRDLYNNGGGGLFSGPFSSYPGCEDLNIHQNTVDLTLGSGPALFLMGAASGGASVMGEGLNFTENEMHLSLNAMDAFTSICGQIVSSHPANPSTLCSGGSTGTTYAQMLNSSFIHAGTTITGSWHLTNNVIIGALTTRGLSAWTDVDQATLSGIAANFPPGNIFPTGATMAARRAAVKWDPITFRIVPSVWNNGDIGANVDAINSATGTVTAIIVTPSPGSVQFTYVAPDARVCSIDSSSDGTSWRRFTDLGGTPARLLTIPNLNAATAYSYRLMCYFDQTSQYEFQGGQITTGSFTTLPAVGAQTITFSTQVSVALGTAPLTMVGTASSGLPVSFASTTTSVCTVSGSTVTLLAAGTCSITASQPGNSYYAAAPAVAQSFAVTPTAQTISFSALSNIAFGAPPFAVSALATSGLPVTFTSTTGAACTVSGSTVTIVAAGTCSITAGQAGNGSYAAANPVTQSFAITQATQTITFGPLNNVAVGTPPFAVNAAANSGLPVSFTSTTGAACTVSGSTVTIVAPGTCSITASQAGNGSYAAANPVTQSFSITQAVQSAPLAITKYHNDNGGTGVNSDETILTPANVKTNFGKLYSLPVDGQIYAQPLYVSSVPIPGSGTRNVLYVVTEHDSVYAFDADSSSTIPLWRSNLGTSILCAEIVGCNRDLTPEIGITSTPVIDISNHAIYVVAETFNMGTAAFTLHSLDIATGSEKPGSPVAISGQVPGTSSDGNGSMVTFNPIMHWQRTALLELNGTVYIGFGGHQDTPAYHGWIFGYDGVSLRQLVLTCVSPNAGYAGIWQGGAGLTADSSGNIYVATGNGMMTAPSGSDYGDSVLKLDPLSHLAVKSYFSPSNEVLLNATDTDLGSGGVLVVPGSIPQIAPLLIAGGKDGRIFVLNSATLGGFSSSGDTVVQEFQATGHNFGGEVFFNNALYTWGAGDFLRRFEFSGTSFALSSTSTFTNTYGYANAPAMSISSNGLTNGIVWAAWSTGGSTSGAAYPGTLHAFDASDVSLELWNSDQKSSDYSGSWAKWSPPTIANGKVYVATFDWDVTVFGLLPYVPGTPASISATGTPQQATVNAGFATGLQATVKDAGNNLLSGVAVTFTAPTTGASATFSGSGITTAVTNARGIATAPALTANGQAGTYTITASVAGVGITASFNLTNLPGAPASISPTAGTPQSATVSTAFTTALQATVKDANDNPLSGVTVTFTAPSAGASAAFTGSATASVITNASGIATAPALTANSQAGSYTVTAAVAGVSSPARLNLTNTPVAVISAMLVQQAPGANIGNNQNTLTVTLRSAPGSGNVLILFFDQVSASQTITSITGATWTRIAQNYSGNIGDSEIWFGTNPTSSTITITGANYFGTFQPGYAIVGEFSGIGTAIDGAPLLTTGGTWPVTTGSLTTSARDLLLTSALSYNGGGAEAELPSPWTLFTAAGGTYSLAAAWQVVSTSGSSAATWNGIGSPHVSTVILALKAAGSN